MPFDVPSQSAPAAEAARKSMTVRDNFRLALTPLLYVLIVFSIPNLGSSVALSQSAAASKAETAATPEVIKDSQDHELRLIGSQRFEMGAGEDEIFREDHSNYNSGGDDRPDDGDAGDGVVGRSHQSRHVGGYG